MLTVSITTPLRRRTVPLLFTFNIWKGPSQGFNPNLLREGWFTCTKDFVIHFVFVTNFIWIFLLIVLLNDPLFIIALNQVPTVFKLCIQDCITSKYKLRRCCFKCCMVRCSYSKHGCRKLSCPWLIRVYVRFILNFKCMDHSCNCLMYAFNYRICFWATYGGSLSFYPVVMRNHFGKGSRELSSLVKGYGW